MKTAKDILDKWALIVVEDNAIKWQDGKQEVKRVEQRRYENGGYNKDIVLWIAPLDCIRIEFEDNQKKNAIYITQMEAACKAKGIDYCVSYHKGGKSPYLNIFNIKNIPTNEDNKIAKMLWTEQLLPSGAKKQLDRTNLGWTLSPVIGHKHWKPKYNGAIHEIKSGINPLEHDNEYPKELLKELRNIKRKTLKNANIVKEIAPWVETFLLRYCCENELPKGQRHHVVEKNMAAFIIHRQDKEQIENQYLKAQGRQCNTLRTWYTAILNKQYMEVSPGELFNYVKENEIDFIIPKHQTPRGDKVSTAMIQFTDYLQMADKFIEIQPIYYGDNKLFYMWNFQTFAWEVTDETNILNKISVNIDNPSQTIKSQLKHEILEAIRRKGRLNKPKEPKKTWVQFHDTIVDVKTGEQFKSTPKYFFSCPVPHMIGETEDTPEMDKLFKSWVVGAEQDESYVKTLYECIAYSTLRHQFLQRMFAFTGTGSNGKGCFIKIVTKFLGKNNVVSTEMKSLSMNNFAASNLYKKQAAIMGEIDVYDLSNTNLLKKLTGEDNISYEFKGKDSFTEESFCTCFCATNSLPITPDKSDGFYRRWLLVEFPHCFTQGKDIVSSIPDIEYNNLAKKCIKIIKELYEKCNFTNEGNLLERKNKYEARSNPVTSFIEKYYCDAFDEHVIFSKLYQHFLEYLKTQRLRKMKNKEFSKILKDELGFLVRPDNIKVENTERWVKAVVVNGLMVKNIVDKPVSDGISIDSIHSIKGKGQISHKETDLEQPDMDTMDTKFEDVLDDKELINHKCSICGELPSQGWDKKGKPRCSDCLKNDENRNN